MSDYLIGSLGLAATFIGSLIAYFVGRRKERRDAQREEYGRFLSVLADLVGTTQESPEYLELVRTSIERKAKILLYCGQEVFDALVAYSKSTSTEDVNLHYCKLIAAMRSDMGGRGIVGLHAGVKTIMIDAHKVETAG